MRCAAYKLRAVLELLEREPGVLDGELMNFEGERCTAAQANRAAFPWWARGSENPRSVPRNCSSIISLSLPFSCPASNSRFKLCDFSQPSTRYELFPAPLPAQIQESSSSGERPPERVPAHPFQWLLLYESEASISDQKLIYDF